MIKRLLAFFLSFVLVFLSVPSFAVYDPNAKHSKWFHDSIVNDPTVKSSVEVKAQRTYPVSTLDANGKPIIQNKIQKSTIKVAANVSSVGKGLVRRVPSVAITYAVTALLGKAVDWVMDAENNRLKYKDDSVDPDAATPANKYIWKAPPDTQYIYSSPQAAARVVCKSHNESYGEPYKVATIIYYVPCKRSNGSTDTWDVQGTLNPNYDPNYDSSANSEYKYIPIDTVAQQVISNADAGHSPSMEVMNNTALDMLEQGLLDSQLEAAAEPKQFGSGETDPTDPNQPNPETPTDPETPTVPETPFELPPFCSWATKVCSFIDWMQAEPDNSDTEIDLPEPDTEDVDTDISFGGSCPDDFGFTADFRIFQFEFVLMPFSKFCPLLDTYIKPVLVILGSYMAVLIVGGRRDV